MTKHQDWIDTAKAEFDMTANDARRLRRISKQLLAYELLASNDSLTDTESQIKSDLTSEVKKICDRYNITPTWGNIVGYEFPDPRSGSGLRFILPSGGYNL